MSRFIRIKEVSSRVGLSKPSIYRLSDLGKFPKPVKMTEKSIAWLEEEVEQWIEDKVKERDLNDNKND